METTYEILPLSTLTRPDARAALARQLHLIDCRGIRAAEDARALTFGEVVHAGGTTVIWSIRDDSGHARSIRHLAGPPLPADYQQDVGDLRWPIGLEEIKKYGGVAVVHGPENAVAAYHYFAGPDYADCYTQIIVMLSLDPITSDDQLDYFRRSAVILCDLGDPVTSPAYARWGAEINAYTSGGVHTMTHRGWRFADGRPARSMLDVAHIDREAGQIAIAERQRARDAQAVADGVGVSP